jgi:serine/threonine protein kinase
MTRTSNILAARVDALDLVKSYRILARIGAGGMGEVFLAEHVRLGRKVAIKFLSPALSAHTHAVSRFFAEARAAAQLNSPGIVQVFDCDANPDGRAFIVMEYLEGETLADRLARGGLAPDFQTIIDIGTQIATALSVAHGRGIVHRDLKPANIFLTGTPGERPNVKLLDFGIAKLTDDSAPGALRTLSGEIVGTPAYMSPEQCRGKGGVDGRSDIYALGCVLYEMLCGRRVFSAGGIGEWISAHMNERPQDPSSLVPDSPPGLTSLILATLEKDPDRRPVSAAAVSAQLASLRSSARTELPATALLTKPRASGRYLWALLAMAALAGLGVLVFRSRGESPVPAAPSVAPAQTVPAPPEARSDAGVEPDVSSPPPPRGPQERKRTRVILPKQKRSPGPSDGYYRPVED